VGTPGFEPSAAAAAVGRKIAIQITRGNWAAAGDILGAAHRRAISWTFSSMLDTPLDDPHLGLNPYLAGVYQAIGLRTVADVCRESDERLAAIRGATAAVEVRAAIALWLASRGFTILDFADNGS
jgi:hypothetical protein